MIAIAVLFVLIGCLEWTRMRRSLQEPRTIRTVLALTFVLLVCAEAVYVCSNGISVGTLVNAVFSPVQRWLFVG